MTRYLRLMAALARYGLARDHALLVGRDRAGRKATEPSRRFRDPRADDLAVLTDAAGEHERIESAERRGERPDRRRTAIHEQIDRIMRKAGYY